MLKFTQNLELSTCLDFAGQAPNLNHASSPCLEAKGLTKRFWGRAANLDVSIRFQAGSIHAILGENGAGKTTLMNLLYGVHQPDSGQILLNNKPIVIRDPKAARQLGIGMVHQHFALVPSFTVIENLKLDADPKNRKSPTWLQNKIQQLCHEFQVELNPQTRIENLPLGLRQWVEILKLLCRDASILILDEPTSVLTPAETDRLFKILNHLKNSGKTILLITHKLDEVKKHADQITIMRQGQVVQTGLIAAQTTTDQMEEIMVGGKIPFVPKETPRDCAELALDVANLRLSHQGKVLLDIDQLQARKGEIVGIVGVDGNGQDELAELLVGLRPCPPNAKLEVDSNPVKLGQQAAARYIPADRRNVGLVLSETIKNNIIIKSINELCVKGINCLKFSEIVSFVKDKIQIYQVAARDVDQKVGELSGGNQQKIVLARELDDSQFSGKKTNLVVACNPCKGLDVRAVEFVHQRFLEKRNKNAAILYMSNEREHLRAVCDRVYKIFRGRLELEEAF